MKPLQRSKNWEHYYVEDKISGVGFQSLSLKRFPISVLFYEFGVVSSVHSINVRFPSVEDWRHNHNWPKVQLLNVGRIIFDCSSSCCGCFVSPIRGIGFKLSSMTTGAPYNYVPRFKGKFLVFASVGEFSFDSLSSCDCNTWKLGSTKNHFRSIMSKICAPPNSASLVMPNLWGLPKSFNLLWRCWT